VSSKVGDINSLINPYFKLIAPAVSAPQYPIISPMEVEHEIKKTGSVKI
jgi:hypothetical protein